MPVTMTREEIANIPIFDSSRNAVALAKFHDENMESESYYCRRDCKRKIIKRYTWAAHGKRYIVRHTSSNGPDFYILSTLLQGQVVPTSEQLFIKDL